MEYVCYLKCILEHVLAVVLASYRLNKCVYSNKFLKWNKNAHPQLYVQKNVLGISKHFIFEKDFVVTFCFRVEKGVTKDDHMVSDIGGDLSWISQIHDRYNIQISQFFDMYTKYLKLGGFEKHQLREASMQLYAQ